MPRELIKKCVVCNHVYGYYKIADKNHTQVSLCLSCYAELTNGRGRARPFPSFTEIQENQQFQRYY